MTIKQVINDLRNETKTYFNENCEYFKGYQDCLDELEERLSKQKNTNIKPTEKEEILLILNALEAIMPIEQLQQEGNDSLKAINDIRNILKQERN